MAVRVVIFDLDGTLIDAYKPVERSINFTLRQFGYPTRDAETIKRTVGHGDRHLLSCFVDRKDVDGVVRTYRRHHKESLKTGSKLLPGAGRLLRRLKAERYKLAVASNRPTVFSHIVMRHLEIRRYFDYVLCGDRVTRPKPSPLMLRQILTRLGARPAEALYVGDMTIDVMTGRRARVKTVAVTTGSSRREELAALGPFAVIERVDEVLGILRDLNASG